LPGLSLRTPFQTLAALGLLVLAASCDQSASRVSTLWTDVPEMASYVEKFNASQLDWQILVEYKASPASLLTTPGRKADLVVSRGLTSSAVKDTLVPLDFLFDGGNLAKSSFYRRILDAGTQGDRTKAIPVSFDLPVVEFSPRQTPNLAGYSLDLATLKDLNGQFAVNTPPASRRLAFSPRWESFGLTVLELEGANFQEGFQGDLTWDSERLGAGLTVYQGWPGPTWPQVSDFRDKYLQPVQANVLTSGRIQFYPSTLATFLSRTYEDRQDLDFRYVDRSGRVQASSSVVWAGIPSSSLTRGAAERFLAWFFQVENQTKLMVQTRSEDDRSFGLAGGLSAEAQANAVLTTLYPELNGRLPNQDQVSFWGPLPSDWPSLKQTIVGPWLETQGSNEAGLKAALTKHKTQSVHN
jgi:hypothetical protein